MKNLIRNWLGIGGELEKTRIALGVAREIGDNWKALCETHARQVRELLVENERLRVEHNVLKEEHETQQRCASKVTEALGRVVGPTITKK